MTGEDTGTVLREQAAARYLGVSPRQLRRWRDAGMLAHVRLSPRIVVYRRPDLDEFVSARAVAPVVVPMPMTR